MNGGEAAVVSRKNQGKESAMRWITALSMSVGAVAALSACGGGGSTASGPGSTRTTPATAASSNPAVVSTTTQVTAVSASCPAPGFPPKATDPTSITGTDAAAAAKNVENFQSFRLTMDSVVPKSHCMSDVNLLGVAVWVCTKRAGGTSELDVAFQIPTIVQRIDKEQPAWDNSDSLAAVDKAEIIYCPQYSPVG